MFPSAVAEGGGVGAKEGPGHSSRDTEHPLSVTAITLCGVKPYVSRGFRANLV